MDEAAEKLGDLSLSAAGAPADASLPAPRDEANGKDSHANGSSQEESRPPQARPQTDARKLFVGGLPIGISEDPIAAVFRPYGAVEEVHIIKPNPASESKRGCCFVTFATAAEAAAAMEALNGEVVESLSPMPLLVRVADPPRSREEQRSRAAMQQAALAQRNVAVNAAAAQLGVLPGWPQAIAYGWPGQPFAAAAAAAGGQPTPGYYLQPPAASNAAVANPQMMGIIPAAGGYQLAGMMPQFPTQHGEWSEHTDSEGNKYYYNAQSGVSQWDPPPGWPGGPGAQAPVQPVVYPYFFPPANGGALPAAAGLGAQPAAAASSRRGPKGANLAIFCIPNAYTDADLQELAKPYGTVVYAQVSRHRDTGLSRGYGFVSYEEVAQAEAAIDAINNRMVQGRTLRVEKVKADEDPAQGRR